MIYVQLDGGLGNQLYQYAAARSLAVKHSADIILDGFKLQSPRGNVTPRSFELNVFNINGKLADSKMLSLERCISRLPRIFHKLSKLAIYREKSRGFDSQFESLPDNVYLTGYWQSYRYFNTIRAQLCQEISLKNTRDGYCAYLHQEVMSSNSVAVHVRRGDYVTLKSASKLHGTLPVEYYQKAVKIINSKIQNGRYFIFSDDLEWCKENLGKKIGNAVFVGSGKKMQSWEDFDIMKSCRHHVIANSSFSWWAAWLGMGSDSGKQNITIGPQRWFAHQNEYSLGDRVPKNWITL